MASELNRLREWKESALAVMPDYQKIGQLLGVPLGESIHDKIIPAIEQLQAENAKLKQELLEQTRVYKMR